jgi:tetrapyrrole methylase family protein/MazG family protein
MTNAKFKKRFQYIEKHYNSDIDLMKKASLKELDDLWEEAKNNDE